MNVLADSLCIVYLLSVETTLTSNRSLSFSVFPLTFFGCVMKKLNLYYLFQTFSPPRSLESLIYRHTFLLIIANALSNVTLRLEFELFVVCFEFYAGGLFCAYW